MHLYCGQVKELFGLSSNEINLGENYVPEIHDAQVTELASKKFGYQQVKQVASA